MRTWQLGGKLATITGGKPMRTKLFIVCGDESLGAASLLPKVLGNKVNGETISNLI
jgi:hypothetical protein